MRGSNMLNTVATILLPLLMVVILSADNWVPSDVSFGGFGCAVVGEPAVGEPTVSLATVLLEVPLLWVVPAHMKVELARSGLQGSPSELTPCEILWVMLYLLGNLRVSLSLVQLMCSAPGWQHVRTTGVAWPSVQVSFDGCIVFSHDDDAKNNDNRTNRNV